MRKVLIIVFLAIAGLAHAQKTDTRNISSFKGIKVSGGIDVYMKKGDKETLRLEVSGVEPDDVITEVSGDYLKIYMREGRWRDRTVKVYVTYVQVDKLSASSASNIFCENIIKTDKLSVNASSAGTIDVQIDANDVEVGASSAADIELKGKTNNIEIDASSAGEVDAYELTAESVTVDVSSAGSAKVNVTKSINAHASSGGSIRYRGNPERSNTNSSSGGSVKKSN